MGPGERLYPDMSFLRYGEHPQSVMLADSASDAGGLWRYRGTGFFGARLSVLQAVCRPASAEDVAAFREEAAARLRPLLPQPDGDAPEPGYEATAPPPLGDEDGGGWVTLRAELELPAARTGWRLALDALLAAALGRDLLVLPRPATLTVSARARRGGAVELHGARLEAHPPP
jgi:hypothetical protein